jgi:hypothetical protein
MEEETGQQDSRSLQWGKWLFAGLKPIQPAHESRKIMGITNLQEYIQKVHPFPPLQHHFTFHETDDSSISKYSYSREHENKTHQVSTADDHNHFT